MSVPFLQTIAVPRDGDIALRRLLRKPRRGGSFPPFPSLFLLRLMAAIQQGAGDDAQQHLQHRGREPDAVHLEQQAHDEHHDAHDDRLGDDSVFDERESSTA